MSLSKVVLQVAPVYDDIRTMAGSLVVDHYGNLTLVADFGQEDQREAWLFSFQGDNPYALFRVKQRVRALNLGVDDLEIVADILEPILLGKESALGTLYISDEGAGVLIRHAGTDELLLFNLASKETTSIPGEVRLGTKKWTLRGLRAKKVVFEFEVNANVTQYQMPVAG